MKHTNIQPVTTNKKSRSDGNRQTNRIKQAKEKLKRNATLVKRNTTNGIKESNTRKEIGLNEKQTVTNVGKNTHTERKKNEK